MTLALRPEYLWYPRKHNSSLYEGSHLEAVPVQPGEGDGGYSVEGEATRSCEVVPRKCTDRVAVDTVDVSPCDESQADVYLHTYVCRTSGSGTVPG
jgi:hypothetical protein